MKETAPDLEYVLDSIKSRRANLVQRLLLRLDWLPYFYQSGPEQEPRFHHFSSEARSSAISHPNRRPPNAMTTDVLIKKDPLEKGTKKAIALVGIMTLRIYLVLSTTLL